MLTNQQPVGERGGAANVLIIPVVCPGFQFQFFHSMYKDRPPPFLFFSYVTDLYDDFVDISVNLCTRVYASQHVYIV